MTTSASKTSAGGDARSSVLPRRWFVAQIGAREHYAVPRALAQQGSLRVFYTDFWCRRGRYLLSRGPGPFRTMAARFHEQMSSAVVVDFKYSMWKYSLTRDRYSRYLESGAAFARKVRGEVERQRLNPSLDAFFGFCTGSLEVLELLAKRDVPSIVDQIDPARVEEEIVLEERQRWPGWEPETGRVPVAYWDRLAAEWDAASVVLVNSEWTRQSLITQGVPPEKCVVVPLAYESSPRALRVAQSRSAHDRPLTVLWLGQVNLRKGIPYFIEAARLLANSKIRFLVAGDVYISSSAMALAPSNVQFVGRVGRDQTTSWYERADVFVLPTLSDGFAITQLEALSHGLPVIATRHCGNVVTHGEDGFLIPARDAAAIAKVVADLDSDRDRLYELSKRARKSCEAYTLEHYAKGIAAARVFDRRLFPKSASPLDGHGTGGLK